MKSMVHLVKRFCFILAVAVIVLLVLNFALFVAVSYRQVGNGGAWKTAEETAQALKSMEDGRYELSQEGRKILEGFHAWAILVEDGTGNVIWHSDDLPEQIPMQYTAADLASAVRGYIRDYPTTVSSCGDDLLILGHPKDAYWKLMWNTFDYHMIADFPKLLLLFFVGNILCIFVIYFTAVSGILRSVRPIAEGIEALPEKNDVYVRERGLLCDLAAAINRVSEKLRIQERQLRKKETARANWIAGVSHDIRTPLSMVMGYAGQMEENFALPIEERKKAGIIRQQSVRMKNLVNDLNLSSRLEYNMQPLKQEPINLVAVARQAAVDFMNLDSEGKYTLEWRTEETLPSCVICGDRDLICRAIANVITNAQVHNPDGCMIAVKVRREKGEAQVIIEDDGVGVTQGQLDSIRNAPHYMMSDSSTGEQRHGLGLLIVRQIAGVHHGNVEFSHGERGGFRVKISLPQEEVTNREMKADESIF